ncbi:MAG: hypothetical protein ACK2UB_00210, partial [Anaerolineales bacterium]
FDLLHPAPRIRPLRPAGWIGLALFRILFLLGAQAAAAGILKSWQAALPWWPFAIIFANVCCLGIMILWTRMAGTSFGSIQHQPFRETILVDRILSILSRRIPQIQGLRPAVDGGLFVLTLLLLGVPAILFQEGLKGMVPVLSAYPMAGELPVPAVAALTLLLPVSQGLVEFPWFYGFILPGLESALSSSDGRPRRAAGFWALLIMLAVFLLQISLLPPVFDPSFMLWQALALLPLLTLIGVCLRLSPRWMPWINILHALMALNLVFQYWEMAR